MEFIERLEQTSAGLAPSMIMGIINITPDSFSGDGLIVDRQQNMFNPEAFLDNAVNIMDEMVANGVNLLDIGGESTRPGSVPVTVQDEISRTIPVFKAIKGRYRQAISSIDSTKSAVVKAALENGCGLINDVSGGADSEILALAKTYQVPIILMHNRAEPQRLLYNSSREVVSYEAPEYDNFLDTLLNDLQMLAVRAIESGVPKESIILDPGIGFGKTPEQNLTIIQKITELKKLGYPLLIGASRKSFLSTVLNRKSVGDRLSGFVGLGVIAARNGVEIIRAHDVSEISDALKIEYLTRIEPNPDALASMGAI